MKTEDMILKSYKDRYSLITKRGKRLLEWGKIWLHTDNDTFFNLYRFNFNPHEYKYLYEILIKEL